MSFAKQWNSPPSARPAAVATDVAEPTSFAAAFNMSAPQRARLQQQRAAVLAAQEARGKGPGPEVLQGQSQDASPIPGGTIAGGTAVQAVINAADQLNSNAIPEAVRTKMTVAPVTGGK